MKNKLIKLCDKIVSYISGALLAVFFIMTLCNVLCREVFRISLVYFDELSTYSFIWMVFLSGALAFMEDTHFKVDILPVSLQKKLEAPLHYFEMFILLVFSGVMFYFGIMFCQVNARINTLVLKLPMKLLVLCIPICAVLTLLAVVVRQVEFMNKRHGETEEVKEIEE